MKDIIINTLNESLEVKRTSITNSLDTLIKTAETMAECLTSGHKILIFGNGGSAADAQHIAAEFVNRFQIERPPLAVLALTTDSSILTSIGNDYHFDDVFIKQVAAFGQPGDMAWGISTSGNSKNVVKALEYAKDKGLTTLGMGGQGGIISTLCDLVLRVDSPVTARIQECHITMGHILCDLVDRILFPMAFSAKTK
ncbi:MAG: D-sedoheptulose 7-phosphate isomerase [Proteobacteria bacterium]|nr:D-sedoheptulose 7-phosphate isomerase [Pseudomonadota bacterium]